MSKRHLIIGFFVVALSVSLSFDVLALRLGSQTGQRFYDIVLKELKKIGVRDAYCFEADILSSGYLFSNGRSNSWMMSFYSPTRGSFRAMLMNRNFFLQQLPGAYPRARIEREWLDGKKLFKAAKDKAKEQGKSIPAGAKARMQFIKQGTYNRWFFNFYRGRNKIYSCTIIAPTYTAE